MIYIKDSHILPIRTIIAISIVLLITSLLNIPGHWGIIAVVSTSLGSHTRDIISRSYTLVSATITGCILGTGLVFLLQFFKIADIYLTALATLIAIVTLYFNTTNYYLGVGFNSIFIIMLSAINQHTNSYLKIILIRSLDIGIGTLAFLLTSLYIRKRKLYKELCEQIILLYQEHLSLLENISANPELLQKSQVDVDILESKKSDTERLLFEASMEISEKQSAAFENLLELMEDLTVFYSSVQNFMRLYTASQEMSNFYMQKTDLFMILLKKRYQDLKQQI